MKKLFVLFTIVFAVFFSGCSFNNTDLEETPNYSTQIPSSLTQSTDSHTFQTVTITQEMLAGEWIIDETYTTEYSGMQMQEMFGSAYADSSSGMKFDENSNFSYWIAIEVEGKGSFQNMGRYITIEITESTRAPKQFNLWITMVDGNLRLMLDDGGALIFWRKNE